MGSLLPADQSPLLVLKEQQPPRSCICLRLNSASLEKHPSPEESLHFHRVPVLNGRKIPAGPAGRPRPWGQAAPPGPVLPAVVLALQVQLLPACPTPASLTKRLSLGLGGGGGGLPSGFPELLPATPPSWHSHPLLEMRKPECRRVKSSAHGHPARQRWVWDLTSLCLTPQLNHRSHVALALRLCPCWV